MIDRVGKRNILHLLYIVVRLEHIMILFTFVVRYILRRMMRQREPQGDTITTQPTLLMLTHNRIAAGVNTAM